MGPPPRSLAADAHSCIMVRMMENNTSIIPRRIQGCWRDHRCTYGKYRSTYWQARLWLYPWYCKCR